MLHKKEYRAFQEIYFLLNLLLLNFVQFKNEAVEVLPPQQLHF